MTGQNRSFEVDSKAHDLIIKMDFYKSKIQIPEGENDIYMTIAMKGDSPAGWFLNSFTRGALQIQIVTKSEFDEFDQHYLKTTKPLHKIDSVSFVITAGIIVSLLYTIFSRPGVSDDTSQIIWATSIIGATTLLVIWKDRRNISVFTYKSRMILFAALLLIVLFSLSMQNYLSLGWLLVLLPITVLFRTMMIDRMPKQTR